MPQVSQGAEFGKSDMQGALISNLFGEADDAPVKKQAQPKAAPAPKEKSNKGGLFGGLFGSGKANAPQQQPVQQVPMQNPGMAQVPPMPAVQNPGMMQVQNMPAPFFETEDVTCIGGMEEPVQDGNLISMQLEEDRGYQFPKYVEIDLSKGYATVGRFDKAGNPQADFNFEASLSFVSRRHFRIEKAGDAYKIVDLGSGNGTMLNSQVLVPNMPYPMKRGDRITISKNHKVTYRVC
ncbi:MAG: FHA domain-containing protein [Lachnospiraceae bacterium]|nr:FHA domain-containing protein [Lachnospiraceae bacterium]